MIMSLTEQIESDALTRNMKLTMVEIVIPPIFETLKEVVGNYSGKWQQAEELIREYHHKYRNWPFVLQEAWRYATSNVRIFSKHPLGGTVIHLLSGIFLEALEKSERPDVRSTAADHLLAFWMKLADEMPGELALPIPEGCPMEDAELPAEGRRGCDQGIPRYFFRRMSRLPDVSFEHILRSYYQPKRLAARFRRIWPESESFVELREFIRRVHRETHRFWLEREDPAGWLPPEDEERYGERWPALCESLTHERHRAFLAEIDGEIAAEPDHGVAVDRLCRLPDFHDVVQAYLALPEAIKNKNGDGAGTVSHVGIFIRLKIMEVRGLEGIHEETLREINFDVARWVRNETPESREAFLGKIFSVLGESFRTYPEAALQILRTIGAEVLETGSKPLINFFIKRFILIGFQAPRLGGVSRHWQIEVNPAHLPQIRTCLEIIKKQPDTTRALLSALIVNLSLGGIYIRDTDLFQKDVSLLLHAPIRPVYNLVKQLAKLFPIYFNQIGAEGQLRTVSTEVDELTGRSDRLIHFLRKQSHVESNNVVVSFIEAIIDFWRTLDKGKLKKLVPPEVYPEIAVDGPLVDDMHRIFVAVFNDHSIHNVKDLLDLPEADARALVETTVDAAERERKRAFLIVQLYQLLHEKYALSFKDIDVHLMRAASLGLPDPSDLLDALAEEDPCVKLNAILDYLLELKEVILTPAELNIMEQIYYKRHIAVDIPSMYGSYNERKFDALGLTFRLENLANVLFEEIIFSFNLSFITRATFGRIAQVLPLFIKALSIDGISSYRLERQEELFRKALDVRRFSHSQYMDIFRGFSEAIQQVIQTNYHALHEENLDAIIRLYRNEDFPPRYRRDADSESVSDWSQRISESFLRELIARTFGLQYFDHFLTSILTTLTNQKMELSKAKLDLLLSYDPDKTISSIWDCGSNTCDIIHLGNKGYNLAMLHGIGIHVPPAFTITTEYFRCRSVIESLPQSRADYEERVLENIRKLEKATGREFGHAGNALLVSVRSGSAVSMPGMMNTFLNVGINEAVVEGLIWETGEAWYAWDNYRRFVQSWGMSFGMQRETFTAVMNRHKQRWGRKVKREFLPEEMRELALDYRKELKIHDIEFSDDPAEQLFIAVRQVMESWDSSKAETYREIMQLSEDWGTAVTIQAMVYGNLDTRSGAGVMFTHDPWTFEDHVEPLGDFTQGNQGEDVVGGLVKTLPLSEKQRLNEGERSTLSLETMFPNVYRRLTEIARELVNVRHWAPQEVEFTFQGESEEGVYVLQSRNMAPRIRRTYPVFVHTQELSQGLLGSGIGVSGGALCGMVALNYEHIGAIRQSSPQMPIILLRTDTVPDDIREISLADGILTGKGGATSHAAIVAHRLGKTCVVGFSKMRVWDRDGKCTIDDHVLRMGDFICIDGRSGAVYLGQHATEKVEVTV